MVSKLSDIIVTAQKPIHVEKKKYNEQTCKLDTYVKFEQVKIKKNDMHWNDSHR